MTADAGGLRAALDAVDSVRQRLADRGQPQRPEWARLTSEALTAALAAPAGPELDVERLLRRCWTDGDLGNLKADDLEAIDLLVAVGRRPPRSVRVRRMSQLLDPR